MGGETLRFRVVGRKGLRFDARGSVGSLRREPGRPANTLAPSVSPATPSMT
jgi:hypothetical protein